MATFEAACTYLRNNYAVQELENGALKLVFDLDDGRSQVVIVSWGGESRENATWCDFHSPIGDFDEINLRAAVEATAKWVSGGISTWGGVPTLRVSVPLENLDKNEIEDPLRLVCIAGDAMERQLTGRDAF
jgi:hypothetical protein